MHPPKLTPDDLAPEEYLEMASVFADMTGAPVMLDAAKVNDLLDLVMPRGATTPYLEVPAESLARILWGATLPSKLPTAKDVVGVLEGWHLVH